MFRIFFFNRCQEAKEEYEEDEELLETSEMPTADVGHLCLIGAQPGEGAG